MKWTVYYHIILIIFVFSYDLPRESSAFGNIYTDHAIIVHVFITSRFVALGAENFSSGAVITPASSNIC
jgi:hypothetical protein